VTAILRRMGLLAPTVVTIGVLLIVPLGIMAYVSTLARGPTGGVLWAQHTTEAYAQFLFERDLQIAWSSTPTTCTSSPARWDSPQSPPW
jgi:spermidine/putrescine transport system permease protein